MPRAERQVSVAETGGGVCGVGVVCDFADVGADVGRSVAVGGHLGDPFAPDGVGGVVGDDGPHRVGGAGDLDVDVGVQGAGHGMSSAWVGGG